MAKVCNIGIKRVVKNLTDKKDWFKYEEDGDFIQIVPSPKEKINTRNLKGVAVTVAKTLNKSINKDLPLGTVFKPIRQFDGRVGVLIAPSDKQLELLNAKEDAEREEIIKEVEQENREKEEAKLRKSLEDEKERGGYTEEDRGNFFQTAKGVQFTDSMRNKLISFLKGLNIDVQLNADDVLNSTNFKNKPLAAFDTLQKFMAFASGQEKLLPEQVAYVMYTFLGRKSSLSKSLWKNISQWERYNEVYDRYKNKQSVDDDLFYADDEFVEDEKFSPFAHRMAIIKFLEESLLRVESGEKAAVKRENEDIDSEYFKKRGRLNPYQGSTLQKLFNQIYNWFQDLLGKPVFEKYSRTDLSDLGLDIAEDVLKGDYKKYLRSMKMENGVVVDSNGNPLDLKDYNETINKDPFAKSIINKLVNNPYINFKLSGSLTIRKYGKVYRKLMEDLHDIDGVITLDTFNQDPKAFEFRRWLQTDGLRMMKTGKARQFFDEIVPRLEGLNWYQNLLGEFPDFKITNAFIGRDHQQGESVTVSGYVEHPTEKEVDEATGKERPKRYVLDFFLRTDEGNYPEIFDNYWKDWKQIFEAKLNMGRSKDLADLVYFDPFIKDKFKFTNKGFRFFNFEGVKEDTMAQLPKSSMSQASPKTIALIKDFLKRIGVDAKSVQQVVVNGKKYDANGVAQITQKLIQVVDGMENVVLPEEAMHFAVEIIKQTNPKLYNQLLKEINNYVIYKQVLADYSTDPNYQTKDGKPDIQKLKEEAIGKVLAETIINQNEGTLEKPENIAKVQSWWSSIVDWFKSLFMKSGFDRAAMDIITGKEIGTAADIRSQEGSIFAQKTRQQSAVDKIKEINSRLSKKEVEENGEKKERYFLDGVTKVLKRVSDDVESWYKRRFDGGDLLKSDYAKGVDDLKRGKGTLGHADMEYLLRGLNDGRGGILVDENGHLRDEPLDDSAYIPQIDPSDPDRKIYNILKNNLWERLKSLDKTDSEGNRTVFLSEMQIYDAKQNIAGTIDLLAITPDGQVNIYDWKFMALSDSYEDVPWYKVAAWKLQMESYKTMLISAYGVKPEQFGQTRMIPIKAVYSELDPKKKAMPKLLNVEIGAINPKDITDDYLIPVGVEEEKTGNDDVDNLLKKLNAEYRKLSEKTVLPTEKKTKAEQLNALFTAIRQLQMRQNVKPLLEQSKIFNSAIKRLMERYNNEWKGKDPKSFSEKEVNAFIKELIEAEKALKTYTTLDIDLADLFLEEESKELEKDLSETVKTARTLENTLDKVKTDFVKTFIGKAEGVEDVVKEEKTISGLARWWSDTATLQLNSAKILFRKVSRVLTKAAMDTVDESKTLLKIKVEYDKWARAKGLTNKNYFDILKKKGSNALIDEFQTQFYSELNTKINSKDPDLFKWVKENINISEYNVFLKEEIAKEKERIVEKYKNRENSEENRSKLEIELNKVNKLYNTSTMDGLGWYQYDLIKRFPKEKWQTAEWKELHRKDAAGNYVNKPALDFYDYIRKRNEYYRSIGYLSRGEERTFLPWVKKSLVEKMVMGGKVSIGEQFLREISLDEGDVGYGNIDPHTGRPIDKIPKYFTTPVNDEYSEDLFKTMALYNEMAIKFNYLSTIEDQALALVDLERSKKTIATSIFSRTKYKKEGGIEVSPDNSKNAELIESMVKGIVYGQKYLDNDNFDQALATFGKFGERVNAKLGVKIFPENLAGRTISLNKSINTLNRLFQMKAMGWNALSASSNLFGGTIQSIINSGKYYTKSDYMAVEAWINAKMIGIGNEEYRKKAVGALEYFLPLTENYNREIAKKLSLNKFSQENIQDVLMYLMRQSDKHVQTVNFYSFLRNSIVQNGEVVNAREYLRSTPEYSNLYEGTYDQRRKKEAQFEEDVKKLVEEKGVLAVGQIVDNEFVIPGVDRRSESVIALRRKIQQVSKDALGNMTEDSRRLIDMNIYGSSFMVFKNWIPRLVDVRVGDLKYNAASDAYEWGRMRMVFGMLSLDLIKSMKRLRNTLVGNEKGVEYMREMWEKKKEEYERETGKTLEMTEGEFMDLVRRNLKSQMTDTMFLLALIGLFAALKANAPDDDEDPIVKNQYKFLMKAADKLRDEIEYFYNPANLLKLVSGGIFPSLDLITNFEKILRNFMKENYALIIGDEELEESNKVIKYVMKQFPVLNQIQQYLPMFVPDVAKDLGIKAQSQSGFIQ